MSKIFAREILLAAAREGYSFRVSYDGDVDYEGDQPLKDGNWLVRGSVGKAPPCDVRVDNLHFQNNQIVRLPEINLSL